MSRSTLPQFEPTRAEHEGAEIKKRPMTQAEGFTLLALEIISLVILIAAVVAVVA